MIPYWRSPGVIANNFSRGLFLLRFSLSSSLLSFPLSFSVSFSLSLSRRRFLSLSSCPYLLRSAPRCSFLWRRSFFGARTNARICYLERDARKKHNARFFSQFCTSIVPSMRHRYTGEHSQQVSIDSARVAFAFGAPQFHERLRAFLILFSFSFINPEQYAWLMSARERNASELLSASPYNNVCKVDTRFVLSQRHDSHVQERISWQNSSKRYPPRARYFSSHAGFTQWGKSWPRVMLVKNSRITPESL